MRVAIGLFAGVAALILAAWAWLGQPIAMPPSPLAAGEKLACVSYAPFRGAQTPLDLTTRITAAQIEEDMKELAKLTACVRTYSTDLGLDQVAEIAGRHGLHVMQGIWLGSNLARNRLEIDTAVGIARRHLGIVRSVVVGNEVLLRGELAASDLIDRIREVKTRVSVPVTYADVWEFWLRHRDLAAAVDFVTIHILPYWEDFPVPAAQAGAHVHAIRQQVAAAFPGREVLIGEVGWPSLGRMRDGAQPSPANQARVFHDVLSLAKRENYRVNLIEAFDQPWKRQLEGTVGGHWGLMDDAARRPKFAWGEPVSNHPHWRLQAAAGIFLATAIFALALMTARRRKRELARTDWLAVAWIAAVAGLLIGWSIALMAVESLGPGLWLRSVALVALAIASPLLAAMAIGGGAGVPSFAETCHRDGRPRPWLDDLLGLAFVALVVLSIQVALGLVFDPRYRDFPVAPLTAAAAPFAVLLSGARRRAGGLAEAVSACLLALSAVYIALNEGFANWVSLWLCAVFALLALMLAARRGAPAPK